MYSLLRRLKKELASGPVIWITLRVLSGSSPRESGTNLLVAESGVYGNIGGGQLEYQAIRTAMGMLEQDEAAVRLDSIGLGPELQQCCGGAVALLFEPIRTADWANELIAALEEGQQCVLRSRVDGKSTEKQLCNTAENTSGETTVISELREAGGTWWLQPIGQARRPLVLFGAGHVGQAVIRTMERLPFDILWIDPREEWLFSAEQGSVAQAADRVDRKLSDNPASCVSACPPNAIYVVMTHSHALDEDICFEVLQRDDYEWLGLIGSGTKRKRFVHRLRQRGVQDDQLERLVCPIGLAGIRGKQPDTIALSLAAQLMLSEPQGRKAHDAETY